MILPLRWTEQAVNRLSAIAEYVSLASPIYAEQVVERIGFRLRQAQMFPESGRQVPEAGNTEEYVDLATCLDDLRVPPGNRLHALKDDRRGQHAIAINDQWRASTTSTASGWWRRR